MDDLPILVELFCGYCHSRFFVCCPDFRGQRDCCDDPCRKGGQRPVHQKANARYQRSPEGLADHRDRNRQHRARNRHTQLRVCAVREANQKGRVERAIRWWRQRFLDGRVIRFVEQGNRELAEFVTTTVLDRPHPTIPGKTVRQCLAEEQEILLRLPEVAPPTEQVTPVAVDKTAFVRFDTNSYSVPPDHAGGSLT